MLEFISCPFSGLCFLRFLLPYSSPQCAYNCCFLKTCESFVRKYVLRYQIFLKPVCCKYAVILLTFLAASPLLLIVLLLLVFKRPLFIAAPITLLYTALLAGFIWLEGTGYMYGASMKGLLIALDILLIVFGAIFFLQFLKRTGVIDSIEEHLCSLSSDHRIQVILLAWFLVSFIEGMSGFGTPAAIVSALLIALGFPALLSIALALLGVGASVVFGAVGTPIRVGLAGLPTTHVPLYAALMNMIVGSLVPLMLLVVLVHHTRKTHVHAVSEMVPYALWAGVCLTVPFFLSSFIGQEFPSLIGPLVGLFIIAYTTRKGFLVPKRVWRLTDKKPARSNMSVTQTLFPYIVFIVFLLAGKLLFDFKWTVQVAPNVFHGVSLFNPFIAFVLAIVCYALVYRTQRETIASAASTAAKMLWKPTIVIFCISTFVQLMVFSANNSSGLPGMLTLMTAWLVTPALPFIAPFIGTLGAFISGSATVSNLLFANFQYKAAQALSINDQVILAQQTIGGGVGNTVSLTDIVAVEASVGVHSEERAILKMVFLPVLFYLTLIGVLGLLLVYVI
jgi:lactate permease